MVYPRWGLPKAQGRRSLSSAARSRILDRFTLKSWQGELPDFGRERQAAAHTTDSL
jgi:hypothetical protein